MRIDELLNLKIFKEKPQYSHFSVNPYVIIIHNIPSDSLDEIFFKSLLSTYVEKIEQISFCGAGNEEIRFRGKSYRTNNSESQRKPGQLSSYSVLIFCQIRGNVKFFPNIKTIFEGKNMKNFKGIRIEIKDLNDQDDFGGNKANQKKIFNEVYQAISEIEKNNFKTIEERIQCLECIDDLTRKTLEIMYPDPSKQPPFEKIACCLDFCPENERLRKLKNNQIGLFEKAETYDFSANPEYKGNTNVNESLIVKEYTRSAADQNIPLYYEVRTIETLGFLMDHLIFNVVECQNYTLTPDWFDFLYDCMRSMRKELSQVSSYTPISIDILEKMTRFHIFCTPFTSRISRDSINNDVSLGLQHSLGLLKEFTLYYGRVFSLKSLKNLTEFMSYQLLLNITSPRDLLYTNFYFPAFFDPRVILSLRLRKALSNRNYYVFFKHLKNCDYLVAGSLFGSIQKFRLRVLTMLMHVFNNPSQNHIKFPVDFFCKALGLVEKNQLNEFLNTVNANLVNNFVLISKSHKIQVKTNFGKLSEEPLITEKIVTSPKIIIHPDYKGGNFIPPPVHSSFDKSGRYIGNHLISALNLIKSASYEALIQENAKINEHTITYETTSINEPSKPFDNFVNFSNTQIPSEISENQSSILQNQNITKFTFPLPMDKKDTKPMTFSFPASTPFIAQTQPPQRPIFNDSIQSSVDPIIKVPAPLIPIPNIDTSLLKYNQTSPVDQSSHNRKARFSNNEIEKIAQKILETVAKEVIISIGSNILTKNVNSGFNSLLFAINENLRSFYIIRYFHAWRQVSQFSHQGIDTPKIKLLRKRALDASGESFIPKLTKSFHEYQTKSLNTHFWWENYLLNSRTFIFDILLENVEKSKNLEKTPFLKIVFVFPDEISDENFSFSKSVGSFILMIWAKIFYTGINLTLKDIKEIKFDRRKIIIHKNGAKICIVSTCYRTFNESTNNLKSVFGTSALVFVNPNTDDKSLFISKSVVNLLSPDFYSCSFVISDLKKASVISIDMDNSEIDVFLNKMFNSIFENSPLFPIMNQISIETLVNSEVFFSLISLIKQCPYELYTQKNITNTLSVILKSFNSYFNSVAEIFNSAVYSLPIPLNEIEHCFGAPGKNWNDRKLNRRAIHILNCLMFQKFTSLVFDYFQQAAKVVSLYVSRYLGKFPAFPAELITEAYFYLKIREDKCCENCIKKLNDKYCVIFGELITILLDYIMNFLCQLPDDGLNLKIWCIKSSRIVSRKPYFILKNLIESFKNLQENESLKQEFNPDETLKINQHIEYMKVALSNVKDRQLNRSL